MGYWGTGIFENDRDLDDACDISHRAGMNLQYPDEQDEDMGGKGREYTLEKLNNGLSTEMFEEYKSKITKPDEKEGVSRILGPDLFSKKRPLVLFVALIMGLGANLTEDQNSYAYTITDKVAMGPDAIAQVKQALDGYENGKPWNFQPDSIVDAANKFDGTKGYAGLGGGSKSGLGFDLINRLPGESDPDKVKYDPKARLKRCGGCFMRQVGLGDRRLKLCGKCKSAHSVINSVKPKDGTFTKKCAKIWPNKRKSRLFTVPELRKSLRDDEHD